MVTAQFEYLAPATVAEAARLLSRYKGEAKIVAGGQSLIPLMKLRLAEPKYLIDVSNIKELSGIKEERGGLAIGAATTYDAIGASAVVRKYFPLLAEAAGQVADLQVRNKGTIGGSLAHADPAGDFPAVILALGAELEASSSRATRKISIERFNVDLLTTSLRPSEVLKTVRIPFLAARTGTAYYKFENKASHYAVVGVAAIVTVNASGVCTAARVAVTGAGPKAVRAKRTERILVGKALTASQISTAAKRAGAEIGDFNGDIHASPEYRAHLTVVAAERAITRALGRAK
ncbi:MAG: xanthine dehydrogenase family protein subunit M [SAR202 cluster bacterium]|nr:xanthine dehydrogenase family protein subunit M [SAR202 cluster bacterium]